MAKKVASRTKRATKEIATVANIRRTGSASANPPSKLSMVVAAVAAQLTVERHWPPNDTSKIMGAGPYRYTLITIGNFLKSVADHLKEGNPAHDFKFNDEFSAKALQMNVRDLMTAIDTATT